MKRVAFAKSVNKCYESLMRDPTARLLLKACALFIPALTLTATAETNSVITFTNRYETITNLQGHVYEQVELVRADLDGIVYRCEGGGGRISYTNMSPDKLESLGIDTNRIAIAAERAAMNAAQRKADYARRMQESAAFLHNAEMRSEAQAQANSAASAAANALPPQKHGHMKDQSQQPGQRPPQKLY
jgi:hypothetical protein